MPFLYTPQVSGQVLAYSNPASVITSSVASVPVGTSSLIKRTQPLAALKAGTGNITTPTAGTIKYKYDTTVAPTITALLGQSAGSSGLYITITGFNDTRLNVVNAQYSTIDTTNGFITVVNPLNATFTPDTTALSTWIGNPKISVTTTSSTNAAGTYLEWRIYHGLNYNIGSGTLYDATTGQPLKNAVFASAVDVNGTKFTIITWSITAAAAAAAVSASKYIATLNVSG